MLPSGPEIKPSTMQPELTLRKPSRVQKQSTKERLRTTSPTMTLAGDSTPYKLQKALNHKISDANVLLAEELNCFFACYEVKATEMVTLLTPAPRHAPPFTIQEHRVRSVLRAVNPRKAAGPDGVTGRVLKECADQLSAVFTKMFNLSLSTVTIPSCLKSATIIPLPKKTVISGLKDYRPVALTPVILKCFERLVQQHIKGTSVRIQNQ